MLTAASRGEVSCYHSLALPWPHLPVCVGDLLGVQKALNEADGEGGVHCMDNMRVCTSLRLSGCVKERLQFFYML